jgi:hypothetical protein
VRYTAIRSEGGLLPYDLLDEILAETAIGQKPADFGLPKGRRVSDEIQRTWSDAQELWSRFKAGREKLPEKDPNGTTITRDRWIGPLLTDPVRLSYDLHYQPSAAVLEGLTFAISHRAGEPAESPPVHIEGCENDLDKRPPKYRTSPQAMVQEFLNRSESHLWGVATNGLRFRLLRDSVRTARPTYLEFDLETILEGGQYNEFVLFYRLCHRSRLPQSGHPPEDCLLEKYYQQSIEKGGRVRDNLRDGVEEALKVLGTGFLRHPDNAALRAKIESSALNADQYHRQLLLLVYRLLFLTVAEDRRLIISIGDNADRNQSVYRDNYSIGRLRDRAEGLLEDSGFSDLWVGLTQTFNLFSDSNDINPLGIPPLNGDLFSDKTIPDLETAQLSNLDLSRAIRWLMFYQERNVQQRVNYAALDVEELGSVYESLLDFRPVISKEPEGWSFDLRVGGERKTTGSYYTRPELVRELIQSALVPVMEDRLAEADKQTKGQSPDAIRSVKSKAILDISVCDPACGSGHFILEVARRLGKELARIRVGEDEPMPEQFHSAVREVISHCIHGVDVNPLAVDLCKLALWLEGHWAGKPLSFLDHRIRCGNSLVGVFDPAIMANGIPDEAFNPVTGDDKRVAAVYKKRNKVERSVGQKRLEFEQTPIEHSGEYSEFFGLRLDFPEDNPSDVKRKAELFENARGGADWWHDWTTANLWTASFFLPLKKLDDPHIPTQETFTSYLVHRKDRPQMTGFANSIAGDLHFFHWHLEFPDVFKRGGFDLVIGNPPWERIKLQEEEYWADDTYISGAANKAERSTRIEEYRLSGDSRKQEMVEGFDVAKHNAEATSKFMRASQRYPLTSIGDINTYALFAECARQMLCVNGRAGLLLPAGIATDDTTKIFFGDMVENEAIVSIIGFENESFIFPAVHHSFKFCALTISSRANRIGKADFVFYCRYFEDLLDPRRHFQLSREDLVLLNPNTKTSPIFRSCHDAELTKKIYKCIPVLNNEAKGQNDWGVELTTMFHSSTDAHLFESADQLSTQGYKPDEFGNFVNGESLALRLYEGKMFMQYDHRAGTVVENVSARVRKRQTESTTIEQHNDIGFVVFPQYWVRQELIPKELRWRWSLCFKKVTSSINERTIIATVLPSCACTDSVHIVVNPAKHSTKLMACFIANLNSLVADFVCRQKLGGLNLNFYILNQLPFLKRESYKATDIDFITPRVLELTYTTWDMKHFAEEMAFSSQPFQWNGDRREQLRADLDAYYAHLYGLTRDELRYILGPKDVFGGNFPSETFRVLQEREEKEFGEYRTRRLVLEAFDKLSESPRFRDEMPKRQSVFDILKTTESAKVGQI